MRALLDEFAQLQAPPVTDPALVERMRTEATTWVNAAHMQYRRISRPLVDSDALGDEVWRQQIDLQFLLVALTTLRRSVGLAARVVGLQDRMLAYLFEFDDGVPSLTTLRNVAEHFDDYTTGKGRVTQIERHQLQVWDLAGIPTEVSYGVGSEPSSR